MNILLVCIGNELLEGKINTHIAYIGEKLQEIGLSLNLAITVEDKEESLKEIFQKYLNNTDILITTGGLGPTFDDITRKTIAKVLDKKLIFNQDVMHKIASHFARRKLEVPPGNEIQAYVLEGAQVLENNYGTAPGMIIKYKNCEIIMLPGPPGELQPMFEEKVLPFLKKKFPHFIIRQLRIRTAGLVESEVYNRIKEIIETEQKLEGGILQFNIFAHPCLVDIKIVARGEDEVLLEELIYKIKQKIYSILSDNIYGENQDTLEGKIGTLLTKSKKTLAVAESCTGGLLSNKITNVSGSSLYFLGGDIVYSNQRKIDCLNVNPETLKKFGAVSKEVAEEMVKGIKEKTKADYAIAITGIAGPGGATENKPVGLVYIALLSNEQKYCQEFHFLGSREGIKEQSALSALYLLYRMIKNTL